MRPKVKICGVTAPEEARLAVELGADFVGLNFYPPSPRCVTPERAAEIAGAVRGRTRLVGVFVDRPAREVAAIAERVGLDLLQFHGDETPETVRPFAARAIKALRVGEAFRPAMLEGFEDVWGVLVDARDPRLYGGTGRPWRFAALARSGVRRLFLAGGLGPHNAAAAAAAVRPYAIDLCSGVEAAPGKKDPERMRRLFAALEEGSDDGESSSAA